MSAIEPGCEIAGAHEHRYVRGDERAVVAVQVSGVVLVSEELLSLVLLESGWEPVREDVCPWHPESPESVDRRRA